MNGYFQGIDKNKYLTLVPTTESKEKKVKKYEESYMLLLWWYNESWGYLFWWYFVKQKSYENISIYDISCKTFMGKKPLSIWFKKIDWFIKTDNGVSTPKSSLIRDTKGTKRSLSHRNKSVDFFCKSVDWFICDRERVNQKI